MKSTRRTVLCFVLPAVLGLLLPAAAMAAGHGSRRGSAPPSRSHTFHPGRVAAHGSQGRGRGGTDRRRDDARRRHGQSGPLSYNAYWRAATSPNPPRPNQDYNRYWEKMQAWREYHQRGN
jgi:hypothetical protein